MINEKISDDLAYSPEQAKAANKKFLNDLEKKGFSGRRDEVRDVIGGTNLTHDQLYWAHAFSYR